MATTGNVSDEALLAELGRRLTQHRLNRDFTQQAVADEAGVSLRTLQRMELGHSTQLSNLLRVLRALKLLNNLDALVPEPPVSPIQQLRLKGKTRRRASGKVAEPGQSAEPWSWDDEGQEP